MAYKRMKPVRRAGSAPIGSQLPAELRQAVALKDAGRLTEATEQLEALHRRYPNRLEPLQLLLEIAMNSEDLVTYDETIARMLKIMPGYPNYHLAQAATTLSLGWIGLALERFQRFLERWPEHEEAPTVRETVTVLEENLTKIMDAAGLHEANRFELAARNDEIQSFIAQKRFKEAHSRAEQLRERNPGYMPACNNLSFIYLLEGRLDKAMATAKQVLDLEPDNIHALSNLARCLHLLERKEEAAQIAARMTSSTAFAAGKTGKIVETLSFLGDDVGVVAYYRRVEGDTSDPCLKAPMTHHLAGAAAMRLGNEKEAHRYWKLALKLAPEFALTRENLDDLKLPIEQRNAPWAFSFDYWIQKETLRAFGELMNTGSKSDPEKSIRKATHTMLQSHPFLETLAPILLERGDPPGRQFALFMAKVAQTPKMLTALRDFALSRHGPDQLRMDAANAAIEAGLLERGMVRLWIRGEWQEVMQMGWEIHEDVVGKPHSQRVEALAEEAMTILYKGDGKRGEQLLKQALAIEPDAPDLLNNLANAYKLQHRSQEAVELMRQIQDRFPDYFFGKIGMAHIWLEEGRLEDAESILMPLLDTKRLHITEFVALAQVQIELLLVKGEEQSARQWYEMWKQIHPDHPALMRYRLKFDAPNLLKPGVLQNLFKRR